MTQPSQICDDYEAVSRRAADRIRVALARKPNLLFCAAGGGSPDGEKAKPARSRSRSSAK
jgi:6-phosphogluconolactonase/glucosamine-6-phosphate isomerase/deaminase